MLQEYNGMYSVIAFAGVEKGLRHIDKNIASIN